MSGLLNMRMRPMKSAAALLMAIGVFSGSALGGGDCVSADSLGYGVIPSAFLPVFGLDVDGDFAYVVGLRRTMSIFDISDLSSPMLVGSFSMNGVAPNPRNVRAVDGVAYLTRGVNEGDEPAGLWAIDVHDPSSPTVMSVYPVPNAFNVEIDGTTAYVMNRTNRLHMIDFSDPSAPLLLGEFDAPGVITDVDVVDGIAYMVCEGVGLVVGYVSDPTLPALIGTHAISNSTLDIEIGGSIAYVADSVDGLLMFDISNPTSPIPMDPVLMPDGAKRVSVSGETVHVLNNSSTLNENGFVSLDISDPSLPVVLGSHQTVGYHLENLLVQGDTAFLLFSAPGSVFGITTVDVTNSCVGCPMDNPCPADVTGDGVLNVFDISLFLSYYGQQDPRVDFTCDGVFNFFDISAWINAFASGCP